MEKEYNIGDVFWGYYWQNYDEQPVYCAQKFVIREKIETIKIFSSNDNKNEIKNIKYILSDGSFFYENNLGSTLFTTKEEAENIALKELKETIEEEIIRLEKELTSNKLSLGNIKKQEVSNG